tara:strand:- start:10305 stop:10550 length:246 start_codon:yes stop_codon:yes gene_type:complete
MDNQKFYDICAQKELLLAEVKKKISACNDIEKLKIIYEKLLNIAENPCDMETKGSLTCKCEKCKADELLYQAYDMRNISGL